MKFAIDIQGEPEIQRALAGMSKRLQAVILRDALREGAQPVLAAAKAHLASHVRVTGKKTDPIWSAMRIRMGRRRRGSISVLVQTPPRAALGIAPTDKWYYPAHIELGTKNTPALPFMRPALEQQRTRVTEMIRQRIIQGIEGLALGKARR